MCKGSNGGIFFQQPKLNVTEGCKILLFGLSYVERPILGDHLKAHTLKTGGFHENWQFSHEKRWFS